MKIIKYKKKKNNLYEITLSNNESISLYDDVILKYELLLKKEIDDKLLKEIIKENKKIESYNIALKFLNTKLRTEKEIKNKLNNYDIDSINYTINRLKENGYLNDELYIKSYINDSINLKLIGQNKIRYELKKLNFNDTMINKYLDNFDSDIWLQKIRKIINKKIASNHNLSGMILKKKIISELISKGFINEQISLVIEEFSFNDNNYIKEKEYNKIKNKLSKKYNKEELEYHINIELKKKGFK